MRLAALAVCLAWLCGGVYGVVAYGHNYWVYRGFAPPHDPSGVPAGRLLTEQFWSPAMRQRRSYQIYLPPGYAREAAYGVRFPVLYLLHGSPGGGSLFINAADVGVALDNLIAAHRVRPFLIVMPNGSDGTFLSDTEWANTSHGNYEGLALDTIRAVDVRWPTLASRRYRAIGGNSEGAYGAVNIALHHLSMFGTVEPWSGYFVQDRMGPFARATLRQLVANSPAVYIRTMRAELRRYPLHAYIYAGREETGLAQDDEFVRELSRRGARVDFHVVRGGHDWATWRRQAPATLLYLESVFGAAR
jgi:enterochelin esterase-like enzyme